MFDQTTEEAIALLGVAANALFDAARAGHGVTLDGPQVAVLAGALMAMTRTVSFIASAERN